MGVLVTEVTKNKNCGKRNQSSDCCAIAQPEDTLTKHHLCSINTSRRDSPNELFLPKITGDGGQRDSACLFKLSLFGWHILNKTRNRTLPPPGCRNRSWGWDITHMYTGTYAINKWPVYASTTDYNHAGQTSSDDAPAGREVSRRSACSRTALKSNVYSANSPSSAGRCASSWAHTAFPGRAPTSTATEKQGTPNSLGGVLHMDQGSLQSTQMGRNDLPIITNYW